MRNQVLDSSRTVAGIDLVSSHLRIQCLTSKNRQLLAVFAFALSLICHACAYGKKVAEEAGILSHEE